MVIVPDFAGCAIFVGTTFFMQASSATHIPDQVQLYYLHGSGSVVTVYA